LGQDRAAQAIAGERAAGDGNDASLTREVLPSLDRLGLPPLHTDEPPPPREILHFAQYGDGWCRLSAVPSITSAFLGP
jgi:hypothetical protein